MHYVYHHSESKSIVKHRRRESMLCHEYNVTYYSFVSEQNQLLTFAFTENRTSARFQCARAVNEKLQVSRQLYLDLFTFMQGLGNLLCLANFLWLWCCSHRQEATNTNLVFTIWVQNPFYSSIYFHSTRSLSLHQLYLPPSRDFSCSDLKSKPFHVFSFSWSLVPPKSQRYNHYIPKVLNTHWRRSLLILQIQTSNHWINQDRYSWMLLWLRIQKQWRRNRLLNWKPQKQEVSKTAHLIITIAVMFSAQNITSSISKNWKETERMQTFTQITAVTGSQENCSVTKYYT